MLAGHIGSICTHWDYNLSHYYILAGQQIPHIYRGTSTQI